MFKEGPLDGRVDVSEVRLRRSHLEVQPNIALQLLARVGLVFAEHSSNTDVYRAGRDVQTEREMYNCTQTRLVMYRARSPPASRAHLGRQMGGKQGFS